MEKNKKEELKKIVKSRIKGLGLDALFHQVDVGKKDETPSKKEPVSKEEVALLHRLKRISLPKKEKILPLLLKSIRENLGFGPIQRTIIKIGESSVKALKEKKIKNKIIIEKAFYKVIPPLIRKNPQKKEEFIKEKLEEFFSSSKDNGLISVVIPRAKVILKFFSLPTIEEKELKRMLKFEIKEHLPLPASEVELDYQIIDKEDKKTYLILGGIRKQDIEKYLGFLERVGIKPSKIEVGSLGLYNFLAPNLNKEENILQLNIGDSSTDLNIIKGKRLLFSRSLNWGSRNLTLLLAESLNLSLDNAEKIKKENGIILSQKEKNSTVKEISKIASRWADFLVEEIEKSLTYLRLKENIKIEIDKVILSGGGSRLINLCDYLKEKLKLKVTLAKIPDFVELSSEEETTQTYKKYFLELVTLTYPLLKDKKEFLNIDLLPQKLKSAIRLRKNKIRVFILSSLFLIVSLVLSLWGFLILNNKEKEIAQQKKIRDILSQEVEELKTFKERIHNIQAYISLEKSCMEVLREISLIASEDITIDKFLFEKDKIVLLNGQASSHASVVKFSKSLSESNLFENAQIKYTRRKERTKEEVIFEIVCKLR